MKRILFCMLAMIVMIVLVTPAHALLINRGTDTLGNRLIYDDDLDITWYDFSNAVNTWDNQAAWASGLLVDFGGDNYDDWRLPENGSGGGGFNRLVRWATSFTQSWGIKGIMPLTEQIHNRDGV